MSELTRILTAIEQGNSSASEELLPLVYRELRRMAAHKMAANRPVTLCKLPLSSTKRGSGWSMSFPILAEPRPFLRRGRRSHAPDSDRKRSPKNDPAPRVGARHLTLHELEIANPLPDDRLVALNEALERFATLEPTQAELVKLRYFAGLTIEQTAEILGISEATAKRWWAYARAWLLSEMADACGP